MANDCYYRMVVTGTKSNCMELVKKISSYEEEDHFFRMTADIMEEEGRENTYRLILDGWCAWSIYSCCCSGYPDEDLLAKNSKNLHLRIEIFSEEGGMEFQEHYLYDNGVCLIEDCVDWREISWDKSEFPTFEDLRKEFDLPLDITEESFEGVDSVEIGGFGDWDFEI